MLKNAGMIRTMAREAYEFKPPMINEKLRAMEKWPSMRIAHRIVPIVESMNRLKSPELAELVYIGFVLMVEVEDKTLYPVRTFDFMTGGNSDAYVQIAKSDLELLVALRGEDAMIDDLRAT